MPLAPTAPLPALATSCSRAATTVSPPWPTLPASVRATMVSTKASTMAVQPSPDLVPTPLRRTKRISFQPQLPTTSLLRLVLVTMFFTRLGRPQSGRAGFIANK
ncbi:hypothetical protein ACLKA7_011731 [Drosophila subpalustris]